LVLIEQFPYPAYPDSAYYVDVARSLHAGAGFNIDFVWIFAEVGAKIPADPMLPIPSNAHWMPLASIVQVPFMAVFGDVAWAEALPFALIGAIAAPLTWAMARDFGAIGRVAVGAGILTAVPLLSAVYLVQPDNFSLFQPLVLGSLWLGARALRGSSPWAFLGAGLLAGLATLSAKQRDALHLFYFKDMTSQEIADALGLPLGTVTSRVDRGIKALRRFFGLPRDGLDLT